MSTQNYTGGCARAAHHTTRQLQKLIHSLLNVMRQQVCPLHLLHSMIQSLHAAITASASARAKASAPASAAELCCEMRQPTSPLQIGVAGYE